MATLSDIKTKARNLVNADSTSYTDAQLLIDLNQWNHKVATMILNAQDESDWDDPNHGDYPELTFSLTTNRDYSIAVSEKVLKIKRLDVTYDGSTWYKAEPVDSSEMGDNYGNDTTLDAQFSKTEPKYDYKYGAIWLYPKANATDVAAGAQARAQWERQIKEFTSSDLSTGTAVPGFDDPWHMMLAYGCALEHAIARNMKDAKRDCSDTLQDYELRLKQHYSRKQLDRKYRLGAAYTNYD